jgi:hypothetical protein
VPAALPVITGRRAALGAAASEDSLVYSDGVSSPPELSSANSGSK